MLEDSYDVVVVGGGVAGLSAATFTARHGFDTAVVSTGSPILRRNAHLENFPGFPAGVNARLLLEMMTDQAEAAGAAFHDGEVTHVEPLPDGDGAASERSGDTASGSGDATGGSGDSTGGSGDATGESGVDGDGGDGTTASPRFRVVTAAGDRTRAAYVVAATKNSVDYLRGIDGVGILARGKEFVDVEEGGRTGVDGLYAAGRLAEKPHQAVVAAGHGAEVAVALLEDDDSPFYHDWVTPDRYFTGRDRDLPPGCEEIGEEERLERERESIRTMRAYFEEPHPDPPEQHPSVAEDD